MNNDILSLNWGMQFQINTMFFCFFYLNIINYVYSNSPQTGAKYILLLWLLLFFHSNFTFFMWFKVYCIWFYNLIFAIALNPNPVHLRSLILLKYIVIYYKTKHAHCDVWFGFLLWVISSLTWSHTSKYTVWLRLVFREKDLSTEFIIRVWPEAEYPKQMSLTH